MAAFKIVAKNKTKQNKNQEGFVGRKRDVVEFTGGFLSVIYFALGRAHRL